VYKAVTRAADPFEVVVRLQPRAVATLASIRCGVELPDAEVGAVADRSTQLMADLPADHVGVLVTSLNRSTCAATQSVAPARQVVHAATGVLCNARTAAGALSRLPSRA